MYFVVRYLYFTCLYCLGANAETESFTQSNILENIHNWKRVFALFGRDIILNTFLNTVETESELLKSKILIFNFTRFYVRVIVQQQKAL